MQQKPAELVTCGELVGLPEGQMGNSGYEMNPDGSPDTAHSLNPVPFFIISDEF